MQRQETYDYNNRLQPVRIQLGTPTTNAANYCLVYNYYSGVPNPTSCTANPSPGTTGNNGNVMGYRYEDAANPTLQHSAQYTFDGVNRLATATGTPFGSGTVSYNQTYTYGATGSTDRYGNMSCVSGSSNCPVVTFDYSTNHIYQIGSILYAGYDAAGNMTSDGTHTYQWDAEDRMVSVDGGSTATQKYNSLGQRVERFLTNGSWTFDYLFGVNGEELGLYSAGTAAWFDQNVPMGRRVLVMYGSPLRIVHANNLGTTTVVNDQTGTELQDQLFYPWGQSWTRTGLGYDMRFAGMHQFESPELLYPTDFRKYNPALGRWMTPDPADMAAADPSNPQSWNRYAYVLNNPVTLTDPLGLLGFGMVGQQDDFFAALFGGATPDWSWSCSPGAICVTSYAGISPVLELLLDELVLIPSVMLHPQPPRPNFRIFGIRTPGQTFGNCMRQHAQDYSIGGVIDLAFGTNLKRNPVTAFLAGNHVSGMLFGSGGEAAMTGVHGMPTVAAGAMGNTLAFGRYAPNVALDLNKAGNAATSALGWNTNLAAKGALGGIERGLNMGLSLEIRLGIDIGFALAEAAGCGISQ
ncbi:MAG TPA: RHS repeat-associated core domain-containing protein [Terriglobia bacterium]|nr:RHS repeat-associated core domain-containing protein [Terriglobia bacterium]